MKRPPAQSTMGLLALGCALSLVAAPRASASDTAAPVAVAPVAGERMSLDVLEELDGVLREAASSFPGTTVLDKATTQANIRAVRDAGVDCESEDAACMNKVAILAGVSRLLIPIAKRDGDRGCQVRVLVVDGSGGSAEVPGGLIPTSSEPEQRRLAAKLIIGAALNLPIEHPGDAAEPTPEPTPPPTPPPTPEPAPVASAPLPVVPLGVIGTGGVLLVGGTAGWIAAEIALGEPERYEKRTGKMLAGAVSLAVAGVGLATAGVGAALFAVSD
jgi:hypothetical protein